MIKYTIIIPHYNTPDLLVRCINSIPESSDYQVIVVDDNSPNSDSYLRTYSILNRNNVELILNKNSKGAGHARNIALEHAKGKWLIFSDADDLFTDDFPEIANLYYDSKDDIIVFGAKCVMSDLKTPSPKAKQGLMERYRKDNDLGVLLYQYSEPWGKFYNRTYIERLGVKFDETKVCNDQWFTIVAGFSTNKISVVDEEIYVYITREGSLAYSIADTWEKVIIRVGVGTRVVSFLNEKGYTVSPLPTTYFLMRAGSLRKLSILLLLIHKNGYSAIKACWDVIHRIFYKMYVKLNKKQVYNVTLKNIK